MKPFESEERCGCTTALRAEAINSVKLLYSSDTERTEKQARKRLNSKIYR